jgi:hypothetical protein
MTRNISRKTVSIAAVPENHPVSRSANTGPDAVVSPYRALCSVTMVTARDSPIRDSSQPMALAGRRRVIRWPVPAYSPSAGIRTA